MIKKKSNKIENSEKYDKSMNLKDLLTSSTMPEMNEEYWAQFLREFGFLYEEVYHKLTVSEEIKLLVTNYTK